MGDALKLLVILPSGRRSCAISPRAEPQACAAVPCLWAAAAACLPSLRGHLRVGRPSARNRRGGWRRSGPPPPPLIGVLPGWWVVDAPAEVQGAVADLREDFPKPEVVIRGPEHGGVDQIIPQAERPPPHRCGDFCGWHRFSVVRHLEPGLSRRGHMAVRVSSPIWAGAAVTGRPGCRRQQVRNPRGAWRRSTCMPRPWCQPRRGEPYRTRGAPGIRPHLEGRLFRHHGTRDIRCTGSDTGHRG
ncbi:hypothetical protein SMICM17S_04507 [Streptomyces microflavus]|uniref:Uncharacterized protein n=1 Tax=Streptomyces microflavus DSM 40593 TaxID=1303692 RepID=N0CX86_STRMI|nr:hypothetical protein SFUL_3302 [Streptomyces microflavus DSM 40593]